jgi:hypothetical protein
MASPYFNENFDTPNAVGGIGNPAALASSLITGGGGASYNGINTGLGSSDTSIEAGFLNSNTLLGNLLFPGMKERKAQKKLIGQHRDIQTMNQTAASNNLAQMMENSFMGGGRTSLKDGMITDKSMAQDAPIPAVTGSGKPVTVHGGGELVVDAPRTKELEKLAATGNFSELGKFVASTMDFYKKRDSAPVETAKKGGDMGYQNGGTTDKPKSINSSYAKHYNDINKQLKDEEMRPTNPKRLAYLKEQKAILSNYEKAGMDKDPNVNFDDIRNPQLLSEASKRMKNAPTNKFQGANTQGLSKNNVAAPASTNKTVTKPTGSAKAKPVSAAKTPFDMGKFEPNLNNGNGDISLADQDAANLQQLALEDTQLKTQNNTAVTPAADQNGGDQNNLQTLPLEDTQLKIQSPGEQPNQDNSMMADMMKGVFEDNKKNLLYKDIANTAVLAKNLSNKFVGPPKQFGRSFTPTFVDFETMRSMGQQENARLASKSMREAEEANVVPTAIAAVNANELTANNQLNAQIFGMKQQQAAENTRGFNENVNANADIDFANRGREYQAAGAHNQAKNASVGQFAKNLLTNLDSKNLNNTDFKNSMMKLSGIQKESELDQLFNQYYQGKKKASDISNFDVNLQEIK